MRLWSPSPTAEGQTPQTPASAPAPERREGHRAGPGQGLGSSESGAVGSPVPGSEAPVPHRPAGRCHPLGPFLWPETHRMKPGPGNQRDGRSSLPHLSPRCLRQGSGAGLSWGLGAGRRGPLESTCRPAGKEGEPVPPGFVLAPWSLDPVYGLMATLSSGLLHGPVPFSHRRAKCPRVNRDLLPTTFISALVCSVLGGLAQPERRSLRNRV